MKRLSRRDALRLGSSAALVAGGAWWAAERWWPAPVVDDRPLRLNFRTGSTAFWAMLTGDGRQVVWYDDWQVHAAAANGAGARILSETEHLSISATSPHTAELTDDDRYLFVVEQDRLRRIRIDNGQADAEAPVPPGTRLLHVTSDGARALVTLQPPLAALVVVDLAERRVIASISHIPPRLAWLTDRGAKILVGAAGPEPELWDVASAEALPSPWKSVAGVVSAHRVGSRVALFCRDGRLRWLGGGTPLETPLRTVDRIVGDGESLLVDGALVSLGAPGALGSLLVGPGGRRKVSAPGDTVLALSSRGDYVLVRGDVTRDVVFGRMETGREWVLAEAGGGAATASFSRDGGRVAVAGLRGLFVYDIARRAAPATTP